jgi:hypothetical protein
VTLYSFALFLHIVGALLLFTAFTVEGVGLFHLRRAASADQVVQWEGVLGLARVFGPASVVAILVPGLSLMATSWGWVPWIAVGLVAWLLIAVMGAVNGILLAMVVRHAAADGAQVDRLRNPAFVVSWFTRLSLAVSIVFLMTDKPQLVWAVLSVAIAALIGVAAGVPASRRVPQPLQTQMPQVHRDS